MRYRIQLEQGHLRAELSAWGSIEEHARFYDDITAEIEKSGVRRVLIDIHADTVMSATAQYEAAKIFQDSAVAMCEKVAFLYHDESVYQAHHLARNVAVNRGARADFFRDAAAARAWLAA